jgi:hypothetical protein
MIDPATGRVVVAGPGGAVLGTLTLNQANGTVTFAPATPTTPAAPTAPAAAGAPGVTTTGAMTGTTPPAAANGMAVGMSVPVTDQQGKPAGTLTLNQATGTIQFAGQGGAPLGSVVMDPATGAPVVVGQGGTVLGSLKVTQVITFVPAGQGTGGSPTAPVTST